MSASLLALLLLGCPRSDDTGNPPVLDTHDSGHSHDTGSCFPDTGDGITPAEGPADLVPVAPASIYLDQKTFDPSDCALQEACIGGTGTRLLLRFDAGAHNQGDHDVVIGRPAHHASDFEYSVCHDHFHYAAFVAYTLVDDAGAPVATGHKQGFCLEDTVAIDGSDPSTPQDGRYTCQVQGLSTGWADIYGDELDCQWIDVTEVPPGDYTLRLTVNPDGTVPETDLGNNTIEVPVTVAATDLSRACGTAEAPGLDASCGWSLDHSTTCTPGEHVEVGCSAACGLGSCTGDPLLRICPGTDSSCLRSAALSRSDGCNSPCPKSSFTCPPGGAYTVWTGEDEPSTCDLQTTTEPAPDLLAPCPGDDSGEGRDCGWTTASSHACNPGFEYWVGCNPGLCGLDVCPGDEAQHGLDAIACTGDPVLRVCPGDAPCPASAALSLQNDNCGSTCPAALFTCPPGGSYTVLSASNRPWQESSCDVGAVRLIDL